MSASKPAVNLAEIIDIYTYHCIDGYIRTRCRKHVATKGTYAVINSSRALVAKSRKPRQSCIECSWPTKNQGVSNE